MVIDHVGIVVRRLERSIEAWGRLFGYARASEIVVNTRQQVRIVFLAKADSITIKLLEPTGADSPVALFASKGGGLHHLCFRCDDLKVDVPLLQERGARLLVPPQPGEAFNDHDIAFLYAANLNVELIDSGEKRGWTGDNGESARGVGSAS